ncbi:MAG: RidA family protein [candidate division NC10 bacterium]|nr:RidA family protein [candidate division NC10 bacterium]
MKREVVSTERAPKAIGPYVQAIKANGFLFTSGQVALDPQTGKLISGDISAQTHQVFENLKAVLEAAGTSLERAVKINVYLTDMADFPKMNEVFAEYVGKDKPARTTIGVAQLPLGARVEIDVVALCP